MMHSFIHSFIQRATTTPRREGHRVSTVSYKRDHSVHFHDETHITVTLLML